MLEIRHRPPWIDRDVWASRRNAGGVYVDGNNDMAMLNCCKLEVKQNCEFSHSGRTYTLCDIAEGEELFVYYGHAYWECDE